MDMIFSLTEIFAILTLALIHFSEGSRFVNKGISNTINNIKHLSPNNHKAWIKCNPVNNLYSASFNSAKSVRGTLESKCDNRLDFFTLQSNRSHHEGFNARDCDKSYTPQIDKRKSILGISLVLAIYFIISLIYNYRRRISERERVAKAIEEYEKDKLEYIETGNTRDR